MMDLIERHERSFNFGDTPVRVHVEDDGAIWWVVKDVCAALELSDTSMAVSRLKEIEKGTRITCTPSGPQKMLVINEPGLYRLIFRSRKEEAEGFQDWVFHEVLPQIRRTGRYEKDPEPSTTIEALERRIENLERRPDPSPASRPAAMLAQQAIAMRDALERRGSSPQEFDDFRAAWLDSIMTTPELNDRDVAELMKVFPYLQPPRKEQKPKRLASSKPKKPKWSRHEIELFEEAIRKFRGLAKADNPRVFPNNRPFRESEIYGFDLSTRKKTRIWTSFKMLRRIRYIFEQPGVTPRKWIQWCIENGHCEEGGRETIMGYRRNWKVFLIE